MKIEDKPGTTGQNDETVSLSLDGTPPIVSQRTDHYIFERGERWVVFLMNWYSPPA
jgi:hypothetical protein